MQASLYFAFPVISASFLYNFTITIFNSPNAFTELEILFQIIIFAPVFLMIRFRNREMLPYSKKPQAFKLTEVLLFILFTNSDKISCVVLYLVGLSKVTFFKAIILTFFLLFLIQTKPMQRAWVLLLFYTDAIIVLNYV